MNWFVRSVWSCHCEQALREFFQFNCVHHQISWSSRGLVVSWLGSSETGQLFMRQFICECSNFVTRQLLYIMLVIAYTALRDQVCLIDLLFTVICCQSLHLQDHCTVLLLSFLTGLVFHSYSHSYSLICGTGEIFFLSLKEHHSTE